MTVQLGDLKSKPRTVAKLARRRGGVAVMDGDRKVFHLSIPCTRLDDIK